ncbi:hypothetical protein A2954_03170 [Candidatus Roizmanbacteria bacterium RIFCSPLOWO2_01_FULL_37_12]|uniref:SET domain-containing protein n=1 Tax=Candidatus Roizmanbacteria bacterium RIFCSPLOWO2_01_FULL_37_12 TaxID=1802056 RepID=A0A1F7IAJ5_9BACT|nr:MAG: hypothetical protein A2954_03170 [Candidatus Roizmanbacteria bacterium RIFCSPLOWO2_01_FULL_37_12]
MNLPFKIGLSPKLKIRGLIATKNIRKNTFIERCPLILIETEKEVFLEKSDFKYYYFTYTNKFHAIVLGYLSLVNHSFEPNCILVYDYKNKLISLKSIKNIKKGEEITYKYMDKDESQHNPELFNFNHGINK